MALTGTQYLLRHGEFEAIVVEVGAGLRAFRHRGHDVTEHYGEDELPPGGCGATLVPWPNRLRDGRYRFGGRDFQLPINDPATHTAIHGLARWSRWRAVARDEDRVTLDQDVVPQTGWLFELRVTVSYVLGDDGLSVHARAVNTGTTAAPFGAGWHPYFSLRGHRLDDVTLTLPVAQHLDTDDAQIPVDRSQVAGTDRDFRAGRRLGRSRLDDGFTALEGHIARVETPSGGAELWFDEAFGYLQCFTPDDWAHGRAALAIEPMSCAADAFNNGWGLTVLEPGASWRGSWGIQPL